MIKQLQTQHSSEMISEAVDVTFELVGLLELEVDVLVQGLSAKFK